MTLLNQVQFAARHGVTQPTVWAWKKRGWLVLDPDSQLVDAEASDAVLAKHRDPNDGRTQRAKKAALERTAETAPEPVHPVLAGLFGPPMAQQALPELEPPSPADIAALEAGSATTDEARRVKENFLALQAKQKFDEDEGSKVRIDLARTVLFEAAQAVRNSWLGWPTDVGPLIAADLGIDVDRVVPALTRYVHQHLTELGEPSGDFGSR